MKILIVFYHPAHVHTFKNVIKGLEHKGHEFKALAIEKEITTDLLDLYDIEYEIIGESRTKRFFNIYKVPMYFKITYNIWKIAKKIQPDLLLGRWNLPMAQISKKLDIPYISFFDSDQKLDKNKISKVVLSSISNLLPRRSDIIFTPSKNKIDFQNKRYVKKHIKLPTYKELAYLHPNQFLPDKSSLIDHGIDPDEKFSLVRFVEWEAWHDVGKEGFNSEQKIKLVKKLEEDSKVYISGEGDIPYELKDNKLAISVDKIHNLLYHANLFIGDSQTMATEAAILGAPTIRCNTFVGERDMTNFIELENEYGLIYNYRDPNKAIKKAVELLKEEETKKTWERKRKKLLKEKIDLSKFLIWFIDNYPKSIDLVEEDRELVWKVSE